MLFMMVIDLGEVSEIVGNISKWNECTASYLLRLFLNLRINRPNTG